jgi:uncharacterized protein YbaP (TraB family)
MMKRMSFPRSPVGSGKSFRKNGTEPVFSYKSRAAFPGIEVLGKPRIPALLVLLVLLSPLARAESSVWRVEKNGNYMYLGGSLHLLRSEDFPLPEEFDAAFNAADILTLEADMEEMQRPETIAYIFSQMTLPGSAVLQDLLKTEVYELLKNCCGRFGIPMDEVAFLKPSVLVSILSVLRIQQSGFVEAGVDNHYGKRAAAEGKMRDFLEPLQAQIDMLLNMGKEYENEFVLYSLEGFDKTDEAIEDLARDWKAGKAESLESDLVEMETRYPLVYKTLIAGRNGAWMKILEEYLEDSPIEFVIAGLAHFYGPDGLLIRLKNQGCAVEQLKIPAIPPETRTESSETP